MAELTPAVRTWLAGLRSGEFAQGEGFLQLADAEAGTGKRRMCCLGVAGELCRREHPDRLEWLLDEGSDSYTLVDTVTGDASEQQLIPFVMQWLQVTQPNPRVYVPGKDEEPPRAADLASLNDDGTSFAVIADLIEHDDDLGDGTNAPHPDDESEED